MANEPHAAEHEDADMLAADADVDVDDVDVGEADMDVSEADSVGADAWQRGQAWSTWEKMKAGDRDEVSRAELEAEFEEALSRSLSR